MNVESVRWLFPGVVAVATYAVVIFVAEVARKIVDLVAKKDTLLYTFLIELIGVAQQCTCVYENGVIVRHYGAPGFFIAVFGIMIVTSRFNRSAFVSPFMPIEQFYRGSMSTDRFLTIITAQSAGGYAAWRLASSLWYYTLEWSADHGDFYRELPCSVTYKVPFMYAMIYEVAVCFLIRLLITHVPENSKRILVPFFFASFLSIALSYIGVPGLNPVTASSRLQNCPGLDLQWFIITYWVCPIVGWMIAAQFDRGYKIKAEGKKKVNVNGKEKLKSKKN
ncbi:Aquaporin [Aphelenchoides fujianensis]|nr:Aquaporin [Aphelenchoides fujianensis]